MILISFLWSFKQHKRHKNEEKYAYNVFEILDYHIFIINLYRMLKIHGNEWSRFQNTKESWWHVLWLFQSHRFINHESNDIMMFLENYDCYKNVTLMKFLSLIVAEDVKITHSKIINIS